MVEVSSKLSPADPVREAAEQVAYAAQYDNMVERNTGLALDQRTPICIALGDLDAGRLDDAAAVLEALDAGVKNHPFVLDVRARACWLAGDKSGATTLWRTALSQQPDYDLKARIERNLEIIERR
jgi:hypothetical protein